MPGRCGPGENRLSSGPIGLVYLVSSLEDAERMGMKSRWVVMASAVLVAAQLSCSSGPGTSGPAEVGSLAPTFSLPDLQGRQVSLEKFRGKVVMLDFWATWCGPCRMTMPLVDRLQKEFPNEMVLLAINLQETPEEVRTYVERRKIEATVLLDETGEVGFAYRSESIPMQVLIDKEGVIRHIQVGYHSRMDQELRAEIQKLLSAE